MYLIKCTSLIQSYEEYLPINYVVLITVMISPLRRSKILSVLWNANRSSRRKRKDMKFLTVKEELVCVFLKRMLEVSNHHSI